MSPPRACIPTDVHRLIDVLQKLVDAGNTVVVIEHNLDVIKTADYIIDLGPEGGSGGGSIVCHRNAGGSGLLPRKLYGAVFAKGAQRLSGGLCSAATVVNCAAQPRNEKMENRQAPKRPSVHKMKQKGGRFMEFAELLQQSFLALFAAIGIAWAVWTVVEALFLSRREPLERCLVLVPVTRDAPALERTVAGLQWTHRVRVQI